MSCQGNAIMSASTLRTRNRILGRSMYLKPKIRFILSTEEIKFWSCKFVKFKSINRIYYNSTLVCKVFIQNTPTESVWSMYL